MDTCPSGRQVEITYNDQRTTVVEVGGGIRRYEVGGRSLFGPYPIDTMSDGGHGAPLIPWPNRLADGQSRFNDEHQLPTGTGPVDGTAELYTDDPGRIWSSPQESHSGGWGDHHGRRLVHHHSGLDRIRGKARGHCPGTAHLVVSGTCAPPRNATSADQLVLARVSQ